MARPRRGRRRLADSGRCGLPRARALGRAAARLGAGQRAAQPVHGRWRRAVRLRRAGADRRLLPRRRPGRRQANLNLVGVGGYPDSEVRWPGSFGSAYMYFLMPRVILFREEHTPRVCAQGGVRQRPRHQPANVYRPGGPYALVTGRGVFRFERARGRFRLQACIPAKPSTRSWPIPGSPSICRTRCPRRPPHRRRRSPDPRPGRQRDRRDLPAVCRRGARDQAQRSGRSRHVMRHA